MKPVAAEMTPQSWDYIDQSVLKPEFTDEGYPQVHSGRHKITTALPYA